VTDRERRIAENESRFREINERLETDLRRIPDDGECTDFVCECGSASCTDPVPLLRDEYEHVRFDPLTFVVVPGHELPDVEDVLFSGERYAIVRKHAPTAPLVENTDPRS
jgi:hypothetical protein